MSEENPPEPTPKPLDPPPSIPAPAPRAPLVVTEFEKWKGEIPVRSYKQVKIVVGELQGNVFVALHTKVLKRNTQSYHWDKSGRTYFPLESKFYVVDKYPEIWFDWRYSEPIERSGVLTIDESVHRSGDAHKLIKQETWLQTLKAAWNTAAPTSKGTMLLALLAGVSIGVMIGFFIGAAMSSHTGLVAAIVPLTRGVE